MGSCSCFSNQPKIPDPYCFTFSGHDVTEENKRHFEGNSVRTSKYNLFSFVPRTCCSDLVALFQQFKRLANIYFLVIAVLQSIPAISPLTPITAWAPLIVVIVISMVREGTVGFKLGIEDYSRYKSDKQLNQESKTNVRRDGKFVEVPWSDVIIGDLVMTEEGDMFPADLILLASSIPGGNAYIETASLDGKLTNYAGEKNLKPRVASK